MKRKLDPYSKYTENFRVWEFCCRCGCGFGQYEGDVDSRLPQGLQQLRFLYGDVIRVNSGCRCRKHNTSLLGSSPKSQHLLGKAADISGPPERLRRAAEQVLAFKNGGIFVYPWGIHVDCGPGPRRGDFR